MVKGTSLARLKKRAQQALEKDPNDRTYKEIKDISSWQAVTERWGAMKGNQYATGIVRSEKTRKKMREAQRMRRKKELRRRLANMKVRIYFFVVLSCVQNRHGIPAALDFFCCQNN
jgi:hypothetical protein